MTTKKIKFMFSQKEKLTKNTEVYIFVNDVCARACLQTYFLSTVIIQLYDRKRIMYLAPLKTKFINSYSIA